MIGNVNKTDKLDAKGLATPPPPRQPPHRLAATRGDLRIPRLTAS